MPEQMVQAPQAPAQEQQEQGGGARELVASIQSNLSQLVEGLGASGMEAEAQQLGQVLAQYEQVIESLGASPAGTPQGQVMPGEAGQNSQPVV